MQAQLSHDASAIRSLCAHISSTSCAACSGMSHTSAAISIRAIFTFASLTAAAAVSSTQVGQLGGSSQHGHERMPNAVPSEMPW